MGRKERTSEMLSRILIIILSFCAIVNALPRATNDGNRSVNSESAPKNKDASSKCGYEVQTENLKQMIIEST